MLAEGSARAGGAAASSEIPATESAVNPRADVAPACTAGAVSSLLTEHAQATVRIESVVDSDSKAPRRTSGRKSIDAETRARLACAKQYGKEAVGQRVSLFWAGEDRWFDGTVKGYSLADGQHCVKYDDGDQWHYHLGREETLGYLSWLSLEAKAATSGGERPLASSATRQRQPRGDVQPEEPQQKRQVAAAEEAAPKVVTEAEGLKLACRAAAAPATRACSSRPLASSKRGTKEQGKRSTWAPLPRRWRRRWPTLGT